MSTGLPPTDPPGPRIIETDPLEAVESERGMRERLALRNSLARTGDPALCAMGTGLDRFIARSDHSPEE